MDTCDNGSTPQTASSIYDTRVSNDIPLSGDQTSSNNSIKHTTNLKSIRVEEDVWRHSFDQASRQYIAAFDDPSTNPSPPAKRQKKGKKRGIVTPSGINDHLLIIKNLLLQLDRSWMSGKMDDKEIIRLLWTCSIEVNQTKNVEQMDKALNVLYTSEKAVIQVQLYTLLSQVVLTRTESHALGYLLELCVGGEWKTSMIMWLFMADMNTTTIVSFLFDTWLENQHEEKIEQLLELLFHCQTMTTEGVLRSRVREILQSPPIDPIKCWNRLQRILTLAQRSATFVKAIDAQLIPWMITNETISTWYERLNGRLPEHDVSMLLVEVILSRGSELSISFVEMLLEIEKIVLEGTEPLKTSVKEFYKTLIARIELEQQVSILQSVSKHLPYITIQVVAHIRSNEKVEMWKPWLVLLTERISRTNVLKELVLADLVLHDSHGGQENHILLLCPLLQQLLGTKRIDQVMFLNQMVLMCQETVSLERKHRLLSILHFMRGLRKEEHPLSIHLNHVVDGKDVDLSRMLQAMDEMTPWTENGTIFTEQSTLNGCSMWEYLVDLLLASQKNQQLEYKIFEMLGTLPFPSLENPLWQYRCLNKLTSAFIKILQQYKTFRIHQPRRVTRIEGCLQQLQNVILRVVWTEGFVAQYASSVLTQWMILWMDRILFTTTSPTCIPTHFPSPSQRMQSPSTDDEQSQEEEQEQVSPSLIIRSERTITSKCTNLQSSQVITQHASHQTPRMMYRNALDQTWIQEMHIASECSTWAMSVISPLPQHKEKQRCLQLVIDALLERLTPCCGLVSDDIYKETLPNRSSIDMDLRTEQWLHHYPAFLPLIRLMIHTAITSNHESAITQALRLVPILKSALIVLIGHWNSVKSDEDLTVDNMDVPPYMRHTNQLPLSCQLLSILRLSGSWIPIQLANCVELLPLVTPADIRAILLSCWYYLADHPPTTLSKIEDNGAAHLEFYLIPIRKAVHRNIHVIGAQAVNFMC